MRTISLTLLLILGFLGSCFAQQYLYQPYTIKDGLPGSVVYDVMQDSKGFIWFATECGISRFDGSFFTNYSTENGLPDNDVLNMMEDSRGRIWFVSHSGIPVYYFNGKFFSYSGHEFFRKMGNTVIFSPYEDRRGNIWFQAQERGLFKIDTSNKITGYPRASFKSPVGGVYKEDDSGIWFTSVKGFHIISEEGTIHFKEAGTVFTFSGTVRLQNGKRITFTKENIYHASDSGFRKIKLHNYFPGRDINALYAEEDFVWICTTDGVLKLDPVSFSITSACLEGKNISNVTKDRENNLWFTTLGEGIRLQTSSHARHIEASPEIHDNGITSICVDNDRNIWATTFNGHITKYDIGTGKPVIFSPNGRLYDILLHSDGSIYCGGFGLKRILNGKIQAIGNSTAPVKSIAEGPNGEVYIAGYSGISKVDPEKNELIPVSGKYGIGRAISVAVKPDGEILFCSNSELLGIRNDSLIPYGRSDARLREKITDIKTVKNEVWLSTYNSGVRLLRGNTVTSVTTGNGLSSNICQRLFIDAGGKVWVATNKGISRIETAKDGSLKIRNYTSTDGLISNEVKDIYVERGVLWAATLEGISILDIDKIDEESPSPPVYITGVKFSDKDTLLLSSYEVDPEHNTIKISFIGLSYKSKGKMLYRYKMEGLDQNWSYTSFTEMQYPSLPAGSYNFLVSARNAYGQWSKVPAKVKFTILPSLYQTWWFRSLTLLVTLFSIILTAYLRIRKVKFREQQKTEMNKKLAETELKALQAQMSPHFIFNSLNSIQQFISNNEKQKANKYLSSFSKLMRTIMDQASKKMVPVEEEMETLKLYLELENLRLGNRFTYEIKIDPSIHLYDEGIPPLLIQPFVENAIWHGISHLPANGHISLSLEKKEEHMVVTVKDNGIGRKRASELQKPLHGHHRSRGIKNTEERLEVMDIKRKATGRIEIIDLLNESEEAAGTKVILHLPLEPVY